MRLTVLGCGGALMPPGGACSGYLIEAGETKLLVDCGSAVLSKLQEIADFRAIEAIVVSHWHADHWLDLVPYRYGIQLGQRPVAVPPRLYLPPGGAAVLANATAFLDPTGQFFSGVFRVAEYDPAAGLTIGALKLSFAQGRHPVPSWAIRIECGEHSVTYSSDTGPSEAVAGLAHGADLFLCEASLQGDADESTAGLHLSAAQAGEMAAKAGVKKLLLTHIWPELDSQRSLAEAREHFSKTDLAESMRACEV